MPPRERRPRQEAGKKIPYALALFLALFATTEAGPQPATASVAPWVCPPNFLSPPSTVADTNDGRKYLNISSDELTTRGTIDSIKLREYNRRHLDLFSTGKVYISLTAVDARKCIHYVRLILTDAEGRYDTLGSSTVTRSKKGLEVRSTPLLLSRSFEFRNVGPMNPSMASAEKPDSSASNP